MLYCHTVYFKMQKFEKQQVLKDSMTFSSSSYYCRVRDDLLGPMEGSKVLGSTIWRGESCSSLWTLLRSHRNLISIERSAWPLCLSRTLSCYRDPSVSSVSFLQSPFCPLHWFLKLLSLPHHWVCFTYLSPSCFTAPCPYLSTLGIHQAFRKCFWTHV